MGLWIQWKSVTGMLPGCKGCQFISMLQRHIRIIL